MSFKPVRFLAAEKIHKDCTVKIHRLAAIAMTKGGHFIARATNQAGNGLISDYSVHAEESLWKKLKKINAINRFKDIVVIVLRLAKSGWRNAEPCDGCRNLLLGYGVREVRYTDNNGDIKRLK